MSKDNINKSAKALMFQGTGSDVGKTVLVAGLCRAAKNRGIQVAPFKPQNMSNNAAVAEAHDVSGEIGRGQYLQAIACGIEPSVHMNPILLKPQSQIGSQVVIQGKVHGNAMAREYQSLKPKLMRHVVESFEIISKEADLVLIEGAGSPAEINLRAGDIANMGFASQLDLPVVLIGDIDRGGVIASIVGTHTILPKGDRDLIAGFLINKFRGDVSLFDNGLEQITNFTKWPSFGVLPWLEAVGKLPPEDSVALDGVSLNSIAADTDNNTRLKIAVPVLGKIANFDDLDPLKNEENVDLVFVRTGEALPKDARLIILPGSKSTISDLMQMKENGWDTQIRQHVEQGGEVIGICGGYQMLGTKISDPQKLESDVEAIEGLGLLKVETVLQGEKITRNASPKSLEYGVPLDGYEIHVGRTNGSDCTKPMISIANGDGGAMSASTKVRGCYLHGLFHSDQYRARLLESFGVVANANSFKQGVEDALNELAEHMEHHLDVDGLLKIGRSASF
ncbi:MAG: cobyric acid synthase [Nitratireductor sp.]